MVPVTCDVSELEVTKKITDRDGVGLLIRMSVEKGRAARPDLKIGICGEQGGDPASVEFCSATGMTYLGGYLFNDIGKPPPFQSHGRRARYFIGVFGNDAFHRILLLKSALHLS